LDRPYRKRNFNAIDETGDPWLGIKKGGAGKYPYATRFSNKVLANNPRY
jgi:hypothetical protein